MILKDLKLYLFRKYSHRNYQFSDKINFIAGQNGSGKTSILEAVYYLALTKSFRTNNDSDAVKSGENYFQIFGSFTNNQSQPILVNLNYERSEGKRLLIDGVIKSRKVEHIGTIPLVIFSPDSTNVTKGTQSERRSFVDRILSQAYRGYLESLIEFKKRLYARNRTLEHYVRQKRYSYDAFIESQDELLAHKAQEIWLYRQKFNQEFQPVFKEYFALYSQSKTEVDFQIQADIKFASADEIKAKYLDKLREKFERDLVTCRTSRGPHQDMVKILYSGNDIRYYGSQGEHKVMQLAIVFAEGTYLEMVKGEPVIYLLDDVLAYLDKRHSQAILEHLNKNNQVFVTATDADLVRAFGKRFNEDRGYIIHLNEEAEA